MILEAESIRNIHKIRFSKEKDLWVLYRCNPTQKSNAELITNTNNVVNQPIRKTILRLADTSCSPARIGVVAVVAAPAPAAASNLFSINGCGG